MLISIETFITCDFPGGPGPLSPSGALHNVWHCNALLWCVDWGPNANFFRNL